MSANPQNRLNKAPHALNFFNHRNWGNDWVIPLKSFEALKKALLALLVASNPAPINKQNIKAGGAFLSLLLTIFHQIAEKTNTAKVTNAQLRCSVIALCDTGS